MPKSHWARLPEERDDVHVIGGAGRAVSESLASYVSGYNTVPE